MNNTTENNYNDLNNDEFDIEFNLDSINDGCLSTPVISVIFLFIIILGILVK